MTFDRDKILAEGGTYHGNENPLIECSSFTASKVTFESVASTGAAPSSIREDANLPKRMVIEGVFQRAGVRNANGREYPLSLWERLLDEGGPVRQRIAERAMIGHLEHPETGATDLNKGAILITDVWMERDGTVKGRAIVYNTPEGQRIQEYVVTGTKIGISSRGTGTVDAKGVVCEDFALETWDMVYNPSTPGAHPGLKNESGVNESELEPWEKEFPQGNPKDGQLLHLDLDVDTENKLRKANVRLISHVRGCSDKTLRIHGISDAGRDAIDSGIARLGIPPRVRTESRGQPVHGNPTLESPAPAGKTSTQDKPMNVAERIAKVREEASKLLAVDPKRLQVEQRKGLAGDLLNLKIAVAEEFTGEKREVAAALLAKLTEGLAAVESTLSDTTSGFDASPVGQTDGTGVPGGTFDNLNKSAVAAAAAAGASRAKFESDMRSMADLVAKNLGKLPEITKAVESVVAESEEAELHIPDWLGGGEYPHSREGAEKWVRRKMGAGTDVPVMHAFKAQNVNKNLEFKLRGRKDALRNIATSYYGDAGADPKAAAPHLFGESHTTPTPELTEEAKAVLSEARAEIVRLTERNEAASAIIKELTERAEKSAADVTRLMSENAELKASADKSAEVIADLTSAKPAVKVTESQVVTPTPVVPAADPAKRKSLAERLAKPTPKTEGDEALPKPGAVTESSKDAGVVEPDDKVKTLLTEKATKAVSATAKALAAMRGPAE